MQVEFHVCVLRGEPIIITGIGNKCNSLEAPASEAAVFKVSEDYRGGNMELCMGSSASFPRFDDLIKEGEMRTTAVEHIGFFFQWVEREEKNEVLNQNL